MKTVQNCLEVQQLVLSFPHRMQSYLWLTLRMEFWKTLNCIHANSGGILIISEHKNNSLKQVIETLKAFHPTIKFTAEWSNENTNNLNVSVRLRNRQLDTDLHIKPTETHQFLNPTSCHPYHCKKSIPYCQTLRYDRICSDNQKFD